MSDDLWGGMFDFNGDGKTDIGEEWVGYKIMEDCMKEDDQSTPAFKSKPYIPASPPKEYTEPAVVPIPEVMTKEQFKAERSSRRITIGSSIIAALIMLFPVCAFVWAAYAAYDPRNSASGFIIVIFTVAGIAIGGVILHTVGKEIGKALDEIEKLKDNYRKNKREE